MGKKLGLAGGLVALGIGVALATWAARPQPLITISGQTGAALQGNYGQTVTITSTSPIYCPPNPDNLVSLVVLDAGTMCLNKNGILVEGASTNLLIYSQALNGWATSNSAVAAPTVTANTAETTTPVGDNSAEKVVWPATDAGWSIIKQTFEVATAVKHTTSVYLRGAAGADGGYWLADGGLLSGTIYFDVWKGATTYQAACTFTSNVWSRCSAVTSAALTGGTWTAQIGVDTSVGDVSQDAQTIYVWQAQVEATAFATSPMDTSDGGTFTRAAQRLTVVNPLVTGNQVWCYGVTVVPPVGPASWAAMNSNIGLAQFGSTYNQANTFSSYIYIPNNRIYIEQHDTDNLVNGAEAVLPSYGTHRYTSCNNNGTPTIWIDGVNVTTEPTVAGDGGTQTMKTPVEIGSSANVGNQPNGYIRDICLTRENPGCL